MELVCEIDEVVSAFGGKTWIQRADGQKVNRVSQAQTSAGDASSSGINR